MSAALDLDLAQLRPMERRLFNLLTNRNWVERDDLRSMLWAGHASHNALSALICRTRARLRGTGWGIESAPGTLAWRLVRGGQ